MNIHTKDPQKELKRIASHILGLDLRGLLYAISWGMLAASIAWLMMN